MLENLQKKIVELKIDNYMRAENFVKMVENGVSIAEMTIGSPPIVKVQLQKRLHILKSFMKS